MHKIEAGEYRDVSIKKIKEHGCKVTKSRVSILSMFYKKHIPLSADMVLSGLKRNEVDVATVYRTLKSFEKKGILKRVDLRTSSVFFELNNHHHHHVVCIDCGDIEDVDGCDLDSLNKKIIKDSKKFKIINEHSLEFFGTCIKCNKTTPASPKQK